MSVNVVLYIYSNNQLTLSVSAIAV